MTFAQPLALLLLLPAAGLVMWLRLAHGPDALRLPGHWRRVIDSTMQSFMARRVVSPNRLPVGVWLAIWTLLVLALARPVLDAPAPTDYGNLAGRVIALDIGSGVDVDDQRLLAYHFWMQRRRRRPRWLSPPRKRSTSCRSRPTGRILSATCRPSGLPSCRFRGGPRAWRSPMPKPFSRGREWSSGSWS